LTPIGLRANFVKYSLVDCFCIIPVAKQLLKVSF